MQLSQCQHMGSKKDRKRIVFSGRNRKDQFLQSKRNYRKAGKEVSSGMSYSQAWPPEPRRPVVRQAGEGLSSLPDLSGWTVSDWGGRGIWFSFHPFLPPSLPPKHCHCCSSFSTSWCRKFIQAGKDIKRRGRRTMFPVLPFPKAQEERRVCTKVKTSAARIAPMWS